MSLWKGWMPRTAWLVCLLALTVYAGGQVLSQEAPEDPDPMEGQENGDENGEGDEEEIPEPEAEILDSELPITVDFLRKDIHIVMLFIGNRSGLNINVDSSVNRNITVIYRNERPRDIIRSLCQANKLDMIEDGNVIIIRDRTQASTLANVVRSRQALDDTGEPEDEDQPHRRGRFNVNFESHELVQAIMEVARETGTQAAVPSVSPEETRDTEDEAEAVRTIMEVQRRLVSLYMVDVTPDVIMRRLASLGNMTISESTTVGADGQEKVLYEFAYRPRVRSGPAGEVHMSMDDVELESARWSLPGLNITQVRTEVNTLLSPHGRILADQVLNIVTVYDIPQYMERIREYMDAIADHAMERQAEADRLADDPIVVREYRMIRDVGEGDLIASLQEVLSEDAKVVRNEDRNSLLVYERRSKIGHLDSLIANMDTAPDQVLITSKLIEVTLDEYIGYGLEIFTSHSASRLGDGRFTASSQDTAGNVGGLFGQPTGFDPYVGTFTNARLDVRLELLANEGRIETLSQPWQMVSNRKTANIRVGQEVPYLESSGATAGTTTASVSFKEVDIAMDVTPTILRNGLIRLQVRVAVREVIGNIAIEGNNTPILSVRESETEVFINDGETLIMGGLIRERERHDEQGLPFLKDIPFLGYLFKTANRTRSKTDLLFFLRPQIATADKHAQISREGLDVERDLRPLLYEADDERRATLRPNRFRHLGIHERPGHYDEQRRPRSASEVDTGA
jgi:type II secretory pathway component GspD/PulD (secretin)